MKRNFIIGLFGLSAAALLGCPVWGGGGGAGPCSGGDYYCSCYSNSDCPNGYSCEGNTCEPAFDGGFTSDGATDGGSACDGGCSSGEVCAVVDAAAVCIPAPDSGGPDGSTDAFTGCTSNASCAGAGAGYLCLDGTCVAPANQCTDGTQCPDNEQCVDGACVPGCSESAPSCPVGYTCNTSTGVCTGNPTPCGSADGGMACTGGTTCVEQHCVPTCSTGDVACTGGLVCVDNGCIPNQKPNFVCNNDGQAGDGKSGDCAVGSVCLHHSCYIACDGNPDASDAGGFCTTATGDKFDVCKPVTESTSDGGAATYYVCGSTSNLGGQCDPTSTPPVTCTGAGQVCIDGYCR